jgi:hypothetical protein
MKTFILSILLTITTASLFAQSKTLDKSKPVQTVEAACGQCQLGLKGKGCDLAVRIKGKAYFVDGVHIDSLGDAHAKDGFCNAISKAKVQGEVVDGRFKVTYMELVKK